MRFPEFFFSFVKKKCFLLIFQPFQFFQVPRQYIHVQPFSTDNDLPDYDLDEEDVGFLKKILKEDKKFDVDEATFEGMLDRLEKNSGHSVIEVQEAKSLLQEDDELILAGAYTHKRRHQGHYFNK